MAAIAQNILEIYLFKVTFKACYNYLATTIIGKFFFKGRFNFWKGLEFL